MVEKSTIASGTAILIAVMALLVPLGLDLGANNIYYGTDGIDITCQPMACDKLSAANEEGLQTRCYYFSDELSRSTYKTCKTGWLSYKPQEKLPEEKTLNVTGTPIYLMCYQRNNLITDCRTFDGENNMTIVEYGI